MHQIYSLYLFTSEIIIMRYHQWPWWLQSSHLSSDLLPACVILMASSIRDIMPESEPMFGFFNKLNLFIEET